VQKQVVFVLIGLFSAGLAICQDLSPYKDPASGLYGYRYNSGQVAVKPKYYSAGQFSEGLAAVWNGKGGYIDQSGREVIPLKFGLAFAFSNGIAKVMDNGETYYINTKGQRVSTETAKAPAKTNYDPGFSVLYTLDRNPATAPNTRAIIGRLQQNGGLQLMINALNNTFRLPRPLQIRFINMGDINARYRYDTPRIEFGLEMVN
jgi:hypothetical protein